ncbi:MAG: ADP-ribose pyrophosphatase [Bacteroidetes bacterium]|nr:ADP-ribose pyrophosphatase [Bacteroidota bacterium]
MSHPLDLFLFCPACGSQHFDDNNEKSKKCADCGFVYYLNPSAATAAFIENEEGELLVCRRGKEPAKGTFDLPGGFTDMDETCAETIAREVKEELNLTVDSSEILFSLPNWYRYSGMNIPTLDFFFVCKVSDFSELKAADDVAEAFFVKPEELHPEQFGLASIRKAVMLYKEKKTHAGGSCSGQ